MESEQVKQQLDIIIDLLRVLVSASLADRISASLADRELVQKIERRIRELRCGGY